MENVGELCLQNDFSGIVAAIYAAGDDADRVIKPHVDTFKPFHPRRLGVPGRPGRRGARKNLLLGEAAVLACVFVIVGPDFFERLPIARVYPFVFQRDQRFGVMRNKRGSDDGARCSRWRWFLRAFRLHLKRDEPCVLPCRRRS